MANPTSKPTVNSPLCHPSSPLKVCHMATKSFLCSFSLQLKLIQGPPTSAAIYTSSDAKVWHVPHQCNHQLLKTQAQSLVARRRSLPRWWETWRSRVCGFTELFPVIQLLDHQDLANKLLGSSCSSHSCPDRRQPCMFFCDAIRAVDQRFGPIDDELSGNPNLYLWRKIFFDDI